MKLKLTYLSQSAGVHQMDLLDFSITDIVSKTLRSMPNVFTK